MKFPDHAARGAVALALAEDAAADDIVSRWSTARTCVYRLGSSPVRPGWQPGFRSPPRSTGRYCSGRPARREAFWPANAPYSTSSSDCVNRRLDESSCGLGPWPPDAHPRYPQDRAGPARRSGGRCHRCRRRRSRGHGRRRREGTVGRVRRCCLPPYGVRRFGPRNKNVASRIESSPSSAIRIRPSPIPKPPWGGHP